MREDKNRIMPALRTSPVLVVPSPDNELSGIFAGPAERYYVGARYGAHLYVFDVTQGIARRAAQEMALRRAIVDDPGVTLLGGPARPDPRPTWQRLGRPQRPANALATAPLLERGGRFAAVIPNIAAWAVTEADWVAWNAAPAVDVSSGVNGALLRISGFQNAPEWRPRTTIVLDPVSARDGLLLHAEGTPPATTDTASRTAPRAGGIALSGTADPHRDRGR